VERPEARENLQTTRKSTVRRALAATSHLAVWPGLYVAASAIYAAQVSGASLGARTWGVALGFAFLTAAGVYLFDRVKVRDEWLDPADAAAHPARDAFVREHAGRLRVLAAGLLLGASVLGLLLPGIARVFAAAPLLALVGVVIYAGRPRASRARPKDVLVVKNLYIAIGITGFACTLVALVLAAHAGSAGEFGTLVRPLAGPLALTASTLLVRVFADAALCDLDDQHADHRFGTVTLATRYGREPAWNLAMGARLISAAALAAIPVGPAHARWAWGAVTVVSSVWLRLAAPRHVRDWVDARFALEAACVAAILAIVGLR
jgi:hypothetical protein